MDAIAMERTTILSSVFKAILCLPIVLLWAIYWKFSPKFLLIFSYKRNSGVFNKTWFLIYVCVLQFLLIILFKCGTNFVYARVARSRFDSTLSYLKPRMSYNDANHESSCSCLELCLTLLMILQHSSFDKAFFMLAMRLRQSFALIGSSLFFSPYLQLLRLSFYCLAWFISVSSFIASVSFFIRIYLDEKWEWESEMRFILFQHIIYWELMRWIYLSKTASNMKLWLKYRICETGALIGMIQSASV